MDMITLLQTENVLRKSAELAEKDPHGLVITIVSISVVFVSLALLFVLYYLIGRVVNRLFGEKKQPVAETSGKEDNMPVQPHDKESYTITICRKDNIRILTKAPMVSGHSSGETVSEQSTDTTASKSGKAITSPLPGTITAIKVKEGDIIRTGQVVAVLEAMKMENDLQSESDGKVKEIKVEKGDSVLEGAVIITLE